GRIEISGRHGLAEEADPQGELRLLRTELLYRRIVVAQRQGIGADEDDLAADLPRLPDADRLRGAGLHTKVYRSSLMALVCRAKPLGARSRQAGSSSAQLPGTIARSIRKSSSTRQSMPETPIQQSASTGEQTIGSPRTLNEVLTSIGQPVRRRKLSSRAAKRGASAGSTVWGRAEPSTWVTAGRARGETTRQVSSMKGER